MCIDCIGSLPAVKHNGSVKISVVTFNKQPQLVVKMSDLEDRDSIFSKIEAVKAETGKSSYAKAINFAVQWVLWFLEGHKHKFNCYSIFQIWKIMEQ